MPNRVYMAAFGSGLGHASRCLQLASRLRDRSIDVLFCSSGEAASHIRREGYVCHEVKELGLVWRSDGGFSLRGSLVWTPLIIARIAGHFGSELAHIRGCQPDVVLSDSKLSSVMAAKALGIPCISLLNQIRIRFRSGGNSSLDRAGEFLNGEGLGLLWSLAEVIAIPDLPPPHTICERSVRGIKSVGSKVQFVGFLGHSPQTISAQKVRDELDLTKGRPVLFATISGPPQTKRQILCKLLEAAVILGRRYHYVISEGRDGGSQEPRKIPGGWYFEWCPYRDELIMISDVVLSRSGHTTIAQALRMGKPMVTIPIRSHPEQYSNAEKVVKLGAGVILEDNRLTVDSIVAAANQVVEDDTYSRQASKIARLAEEYDGTTKVLELLSKY